MLKFQIIQLKVKEKNKDRDLKMSAPVSFLNRQPETMNTEAPLLTLFDIFGDNGRLLNTSKPSYDLAEYYGYNSQISSQIHMYSVTRGALQWMSRLSPTVYTTNIKFFTVLMEFDQSWANDAPPGAPSRMVTFKESARKFGLGRKGLGVQAPTNFHMSARGQLIWRLQLEQVAKGMEDTLLMQTIDAILNADSHLQTVSKTSGINYTEEQFLTDKATAFAFYNKAKGGFQNLIPFAKRLIKLQSGDFNAIITNEETFNYLALVPAKSVENMARPESNAAELLAIDGIMRLGMLDAFIFPPLYIDNTVSIDFLRRKEQVGVYNLMYDRNFGVPGYMYDTRHMSIQIYDNKKDTMETIGLETAIKQSGVGNSYWSGLIQTITDRNVATGLSILKEQSIAELLTHYVDIDPEAGTQYRDEYTRYFSEQVLVRYLGADWKKKTSLLSSAFRNGLHPLPTTRVSAIPAYQPATLNPELDTVLNELNEVYVSLRSFSGYKGGAEHYLTFYDFVLAFVDKSRLDVALKPLINALLLGTANVTQINGDLLVGPQQQNQGVGFAKSISSANNDGFVLYGANGGPIPFEGRVDEAAALVPKLPRFYHELAVGSIARSLFARTRMTVNAGDVVMNNQSIYNLKGITASSIAYTMVLFNIISNDSITLTNFARSHLPIPYAFMLARENCDYMGSATVCISQNQGTLTRYKGQEEFNIGQDVVEKMLTGHLTTYAGTEIHSPQNLLTLDGTLITEYERGCGTIPYDIEHAMSLGNGIKDYYDPNGNVYGNSNQCSIKFMALAPFEVMNMANPISVTGNFDDQLRGYNLQKTRDEPHYLTAAAYYRLWRWPVESGSKIAALDRLEQSKTNYVMWQGATLYFRPNNTNADGSFEDLVPETGPFAGITHEGCAGYRAGTMIHTSEIVKTRSIRDRSN